jgi:hypothetical protein
LQLAPVLAPTSANSYEARHFARAVLKPPLRKSIPANVEWYAGEWRWCLRVLIKNGYKLVALWADELTQHFGMAAGTPDDEWF